MAKNVLVGMDVDVGARILQALDDAGLRVTVALWAVLPEYEEWRLVLSSRKFDSMKLGDAYGLLHDALDASGISLQETPAVVILRATDPFIKDLRKTYGKDKVMEGMRLGPQAIGNRFIDDAYAYRIS